MAVKYVIKSLADKHCLRFSAMVLFSTLLVSCSSVSGMSHNVSNWAGKVARPESQMPTVCQGWQKIELKNDSRYLLLKKDPELLVNIDAHNLRGRNTGCWK